ncbi:MAG TPA: hypothetical protein VMZ71_05255 [Gemmataceae bacterium]|nr:hypothetical protein [Gemmataceae bacterium]
MNPLLRLPAAETSDDHWTTLAAGDTGGGFASAPAHRAAKSPGERDPVLYTRSTLYTSRLIDVLPDAGTTRAIWVARGPNSVFIDAPRAWGKPGGLVRTPRTLLITDSLFRTAVSSEVRAWVLANNESLFAPRNLTVVYRTVNQLGLFPAVCPLSAKERLTYPNAGAEYAYYTFDTPDDLYAGGEFLALSAVGDYHTFGSNDGAEFSYVHDVSWSTAAGPPAGLAGGPWDVYSRDDGLNTVAGVVFTQKAATDRATLARCAAKFRRFRHCYMQQDVNFSDGGVNFLPVNLADQLLGGSPHLARRVTTPWVGPLPTPRAGSVAAVTAAIRAEVEAFWPL